LAVDITADEDEVRLGGEGAGAVEVYVAVYSQFCEVDKGVEASWDGSVERVAFQVHLAEIGHVSNACWDLAAEGVVIDVEVHDVLHGANAGWDDTGEAGAVGLEVLEVLEST